MTSSQVIEKTHRGCEIVKNQVLADIADFSIPVKVERKRWIEWTADRLQEMGFEAMAGECRKGLHLYEHARVVAFETLYQQGGYHTPHLCLPICLEGEEFANYWRAVAIAATAH